MNGILRADTCRSCKHLVRGNDGKSTWGECHFNPPNTHLLLTPKGTKIVTMWARVDESFSCAQHKPAIARAGPMDSAAALPPRPQGPSAKI